MLVLIMCLEKIKKITAEEDIIAYKLLERNALYVSPFYPFTWEIGKVYGEGHLEPLLGYDDEEGRPTYIQEFRRSTTAAASPQG